MTTRILASISAALFLTVAAVDTASARDISVSTLEFMRPRPEFLGVDLDRDMFGATLGARF